MITALYHSIIVSIAVIAFRCHSPNNQIPSPVLPYLRFLEPQTDRVRFLNEVFFALLQKSVEVQQKLQYFIRKQFLGTVKTFEYTLNTSSHNAVFYLCNFFSFYLSWSKCCSGFSFWLKFVGTKCE